MRPVVKTIRVKPYIKVFFSCFVKQTVHFWYDIETDAIIQESECLFPNVTISSAPQMPTDVIWFFSLLRFHMCECTVIFGLNENILKLLRSKCGEMFNDFRFARRGGLYRCVDTLQNILNYSAMHLSEAKTFIEHLNCRLSYNSQLQNHTEWNRNTWIPFVVLILYFVSQMQ